MSVPFKPDTGEIFTSLRQQNEFRTLGVMINIYCKAHHKNKNTPCLACHELLSYARKRLLNCPFHDTKPTCGKCSVHCYKTSMQDKVKKVMKFSGPKMVYRHPIMALKHLIDARRTVPKLEKK